MSPFYLNVTFFIPQQMKFTDAMRSKARLSITGSTSENGRVPVAYLRPGLPMSLSMTDLSWPHTSQCLTASQHTFIDPRCKGSGQEALPSLRKRKDILPVMITGNPPRFLIWILVIQNSRNSQILYIWSVKTRQMSFWKDLPTCKVNQTKIEGRDGWS